MKSLRPESSVTNLGSSDQLVRVGRSSWSDGRAAGTAGDCDCNAAIGSASGCAERIVGAEEEWRRRAGPMMVEELERVLRRYPGDV